MTVAALAVVFGMLAVGAFAAALLLWLFSLVVAWRDRRAEDGVAEGAAEIEASRVTAFEVLRDDIEAIRAMAAELCAGGGPDVRSETEKITGVLVSLEAARARRARTRIPLKREPGPTDKGRERRRR